MKKEINIKKTCSACSNFTFCMARNASDSFVRDVMKTGLFGNADSFGGLEMYAVLANSCRKFVDEIWEKEKEKKKSFLISKDYKGLIHKDESCSCSVGSLAPIEECKECFKDCKIVKS